MRISDWSSDVCSSDLLLMDAGSLVFQHFAGGIDNVSCRRIKRRDLFQNQLLMGERLRHGDGGTERRNGRGGRAINAIYKFEIVILDEVQRQIERKRVVEGKSGQGGVDHGGRRIN